MTYEEAQDYIPTRGEIPSGTGGNFSLKSAIALKNVKAIVDAKHTPGPWEVDNYGAQHNLTEFHIVRGSMRVAKVKKTNTNAEANARLIAVAPELLAACEHAAFSIHHPKCTVHKSGPGWDCTCHVGKAQAAIDKATS